MPAQPATLARELFDRLGRVAEPNGLPDELEIRRIQRDADRLMKVDASQAHQVLGGLAALRWDIDAMRAHHEKGLERGSAAAYKNYAVSLQLLGFFPEAARYMTIASERQPENLGYLRSAASFSLWAGYPSTALRLESELKKRAPDAEIEWSVATRELIVLMERHQISEADLQNSTSIALALLRQKKLRITHISLLTDLKEDVAFYTLRVDRSVNEVLAVDAELGRVLAEQLPEMSSAVVVQVEGPNPVQSRLNDGQAARPS